MVIAVNGSPRKNWNTHTLLMKALDGAASKGAETELVNLYDMKYTGCISCLDCKLKGGDNLGRCAVADELKPVLDRIDKCDALILGSPIYFGEVSGMMRSFMERLLFQYLSYDRNRKPLFERRIQTAFIYTMNAPESVLDKIGYTGKFEATAGLLDRLLGPSQTLISAETCQVEDYDNYNMSMINGAERKQRHKDVFPKDCKKAFELGADIIGRCSTV